MQSYQIIALYGTDIVIRTRKLPDVASLKNTRNIPQFLLVNYARKIMSFPTAKKKKNEIR